MNDKAENSDFSRDEQLAMLRRCSKAKKMTEWNEWRKENRSTDVILNYRRFKYANLQGADFSNASLQGANLRCESARGYP